MDKHDRMTTVRACLSCGFTYHPFAATAAISLKITALFLGSQEQKSSCRRKVIMSYLRKVEMSY